MNQKIDKTHIVWIVLCLLSITILFFFWLWFVFKIQQKGLLSESYAIFKQAIQCEKEQNIEMQVGFYDSNNSSNDISGEEKNEWCAQDYLTWRDPDRSVLDSIFRASLIEKGIEGQSAVRYVCKGDTINTCPDTLFYGKALALDPLIYRIDANKDNNIMLQAYVKFPFKFVLTRSPLFFIILGLWLLSLAVVIVSYCIIKRKRCLPSVPETVQEVIVPLLQEQTINWITLPCGFLFDEKYGDLKYQGEVCVRLKDNLLRLFRSFIKAEEYKLTYEDICVQVLGRSVKEEATKSDRDTVAKNISRLREVLNEISMIQIKTLRNAGYQMIFSANQTEQTS